MRDDFCVFILTHGRPDKIDTIRALKNSGYTGMIYIVIDNEDDTSDKYYENYGDKVLMFDKKAVSETFDTADNFNDRRAIVYARNVCFQFAKELGFHYFIQLDDDYTEFKYRYNDKLNFDYITVRKLDNIFSIMTNFLISSNADSVAMAQGGDFIGGSGNKNAKGLSLTRKCMNTFVCRTNKPFLFLGAINEDVNTYTRGASTGLLFFTFNAISVDQKQTQSNEGGMTDIYLDGGTYKKSFYTVLFQPSSVKVAMMGDKHQRLHHRVSWNNTVPKIIRQEYKNGGLNGKE